MAKTTEQKLVVDSTEGAKITNVSMKIAQDGKSVEIIITSTISVVKEVEHTKNFDETFSIVNPMELAGHKLLDYKPKKGCQETLINYIRKGIEMNLPPFRAPFVDPSEENGKIVYKVGNKPAVGHSPIWWAEQFKAFMPSKNSRMSNELQQAALLGRHMKYLFEEKGYTVEAAWRAVCNDSRDIGNHWNSVGAKHDFESTGSRKVGDFFNLANTCKILSNSDGSGFLLAGGGYYINGNEYPLAGLVTFNNPNNCYYNSVGLLVLDV